MTNPETPARVITSMAFYDALINADVIRRGERIRRVVIDAEANSAVRIYVERVGDTRMLQVAQTLKGVEIRELDRPAEVSA